MEVIGPVRVVHRYVNMPEQSAEFYNETTRKFEKVNPPSGRILRANSCQGKDSFGLFRQVHGCVPAMGYSFAAGTTDGPGSFAFEQGTTTSNPFWNTVRNFLAAPTKSDIHCQRPKPILLISGRVSRACHIAILSL